jgi:hypothetical protein
MMAVNAPSVEERRRYYDSGGWRKLKYDLANSHSWKCSFCGKDLGLRFWRIEVHHNVYDHWGQCNSLEMADCIPVHRECHDHLHGRFTDEEKLKQMSQKLLEMRRELNRLRAEEDKRNERIFRVITAIDYLQWGLKIVLSVLVAYALMLAAAVLFKQI